MLKRRFKRDISSLVKNAYIRYFDLYNEKKNVEKAVNFLYNIRHLINYDYANCEFFFQENGFIVNWKRFSFRYFDDTVFEFYISTFDKNKILNIISVNRFNMKKKFKKLQLIYNHVKYN